MKRTSVFASAAFALLSVVLVQACSGEEGGEDQNMMNPLTGVGGMVQTGVGGAVTGLGGASGAPAAGLGGTPGVEGQGGATSVAGQGGMATSPAAQGGAGGAPVAQGGTGGAPVAQGGTGGAPPTGAPPACIEPPAPSNGAACTVTCTDPCSVHQLGTRVCTCTASAYDCGTCVFTNPNDPLITVPPGPLPDCTADDGVLEDLEVCTENDRCLSLRVNGQMVRNRFCGCRANSWDCDSKPGNFP